MRFGARRTVEAPQVARPAKTGNVEIDRAITNVADAANRLIDRPIYIDDVTLALGQNTIVHGLGRRPRFVRVAPSAPDASWAWGWDPEQPGNPRPDSIVHIVVAGGSATVRVWVE